MKFCEQDIYIIYNFLYNYLQFSTFVEILAGGNDDFRLESEISLTTDGTLDDMELDDVDMAQFEEEDEDLPESKEYV